MNIWCGELRTWWLMDKYTYHDILKQNLKQSGINFRILRHFTLYQSKHLKHSAEIRKLWVLYHCPVIIKTTAQNSDLNPIEHVWDYFQPRISEYEMYIMKDLRKHLVHEWSKIDTSFCTKLVKWLTKPTTRVHNVQMWTNKILSNCFINF